MNSAILVITTVETLEDAKTIARDLIGKKLCACVNISSKGYSIYPWKDKIEEAEEYTLTIKTTTSKYPMLEEAIKKLHKYQLPEIIAIDIVKGSTNYLSWIDSVLSTAELPTE